jgi:hypothetical protein
VDGVDIDSFPYSYNAIMIVLDSAEGFIGRIRNWVSLVSKDFTMNPEQTRSPTLMEDTDTYLFPEFEV